VLQAALASDAARWRPPRASPPTGG